LVILGAHLAGVILTDLLASQRPNRVQAFVQGLPALNQELAAQQLSFEQFDNTAEVPAIATPLHDIFMCSSWSVPMSRD